MSRSATSDLPFAPESVVRNGDVAERRHPGRRGKLGRAFCFLVFFLFFLFVFVFFSTLWMASTTTRRALGARRRMK